LRYKDKKVLWYKRIFLGVKVGKSAGFRINYGKISLFLNLDMAFCYQELSIARLCLSDMFLLASRFLYFRNKIYICKYESG